MDAKTAWKKLNDIFKPNPQPTTEMFHAFMNIIGKFSELAIDDAYNHTVEHEVRFPSIALFKSYTETFQEKIEEEIHKKQKKDDAETTKVLFEKTGRGLGFSHMQLLRTAFKTDTTRQQFLDGMTKLGMSTKELREFYTTGNPWRGGAYKSHCLDLDRNIGDRKR